MDHATRQLSRHDNTASHRSYTAKRLFDFLAASALLLLLLPLLAIIAMLVKLDSPGPVLYKGLRLGKRGRLFPCYKFRTMHVSSEELLSQHLKKNWQARDEWDRFAKLRSYDPRITPIGRILRRFSLDELPQLWNVLRGEMSLSGPRPYLPAEQERLGKTATLIHSVRPGITGLWQVSGRNDVEFQRRVLLDTWYIRNWSFWLDIRILIRTISVVASGRGAV